MLVLTLLGSLMGLPLKTVADLGHLPDSLPLFALPEIPASLETLRIIALPALAIAMVGLLESVLTAAVVDDLTGTPSNKSRECTGLGLANVSASLFGGIAGCGMIGQAVGNVKYGGRGRLSTLFAGVFLLILMVALKPWVSRVPVIALVAIMVMVSVSTFDWKSLGNLVRHPRLSRLGDAGDGDHHHRHPQSGRRRGGRRAALGRVLHLQGGQYAAGPGQPERGWRSLYLDGERPGVLPLPMR